MSRMAAGPRRGRRGAELKCMSAVETKRPGGARTPLVTNAHAQTRACRLLRPPISLPITKARPHARHGFRAYRYSAGSTPGHATRSLLPGRDKVVTWHASRVGYFTREIRKHTSDIEGFASDTYPMDESELSYALGA